MLKTSRGDILRAEVEALVNPVNTQGVMGKGLALQFKTAFPENFKAYATACKRHEVRTGEMFVYESGRGVLPRFIINFPTKEHWRGSSKLEYIERGLAALIDVVRDREIRSIAVPALGAGLGGLAWRDVLPLIEAAFEKVPRVEALLFEPV
jgi:O-acetyl-ADP-ribose deacetylase (regulator of RNase III)